MSTNDVPGAVATNNDVLAMGCWAEHDDGSLILVEAVEGGRVIYSVFDVAPDPPIEYRTAMPEDVFKDRFSWTPEAHDDDDDDLADIRWTWHDKTPFPWERVMDRFNEGQRYVSAEHQITAAERVARSLDVRGARVRRGALGPQRPARTIMERVKAALGELRE